MSGRLRQGPPQTKLLIANLRERRGEGKALELPKIPRLGITQHDARLRGIRDRGFEVISELESMESVLHSIYWLLYEPEQDGTL